MYSFYRLNFYTVFIVKRFEYSYAYNLSAIEMLLLCLVHRQNLESSQKLPVNSHQNSRVNFFSYPQ